jgi:hypothetical protein
LHSARRTTAEWQRIANQSDAAFVFARADFVNVHSSFADDSNKLPRILQQFGLTHLPSGNQKRFNHKAPCAVIRHWVWFVPFCQQVYADKRVKGKRRFRLDALALRRNWAFAKTGSADLVFHDGPEGKIS